MKEILLLLLAFCTLLNSTTGDTGSACAMAYHPNEAAIPHKLRMNPQEAAAKLANKPPELRLFLVRHGESYNNVVAKEVETEFEKGILSIEEARIRWFERRHDDPDLTAKGRIEASLLGRAFASELMAPGKRTVLVCSPMRRAMRTAQPLAESLGLGVLVHPDVFENGGTFGTEEGQFVAGKGLTRDEIRNEFPTYDASKLPETGVWLGALKRENLDEARVRIRKVVNWVLSQEVQDMTSARDAGDERAAMVIVCHADFIDTFIQTLLAVSAELRGQPIHGSAPLANFFTENTSVTELIFPFDLSSAPVKIKSVNRVPHAHLLADAISNAEAQPNAVAFQ